MQETRPIAETVREASGKWMCVLAKITTVIRFLFVEAEYALSERPIDPRVTVQLTTTLRDRMAEYPQACMQTWREPTSPPHSKNAIPRRMWRVLVRPEVADELAEQPLRCEPTTSAPALAGHARERGFIAEHVGRISDSVIRRSARRAQYAALLRPTGRNVRDRARHDRRDEQQHRDLAPRASASTPLSAWAVL